MNMNGQPTLPVTKHPAFLSYKSAFLVALLAVLTSVSFAGEPIKDSNRIPRPVKVRATRALEAQLVEWDHQQKVAARNCNQEMASAREQPFLKGLYDISYKVLLETPKIFSVKVDLDIYCGGAHPDDLHGGVMFDPRSGHQLNPFQMLAIATEREYVYTLKPAVRDIVKRAMLAKLDKDQIGQDCIAILNEERFDELDRTNAVLGQDGLHIMYPAARVVQYCYSEVVLTNRQLQTLL